MKFWLTILICLGVSIATDGVGSAADPFDLASIGLHPTYLSASAFRENATLHAVAIAPGTRKPGTETEMAIAVGDGGTILRSEDAGRNWRAIDRITPLAESEETTSPRSRFGSRRPQRAVIAMPFWHLYDVRWLSHVDVVAIGGGFEPITGISRGVCLYSDDAGATWSMGNAHELPRLKRFVTEADRGRPGMIQAIGDRAEANGVNRFFSQDGGRTWIEDTMTYHPPSDPTHAHAGQQSDGSPIQVGDHGRIQINESGTWKTVRGQNRHAAVAFVCGSVSTTPWALIGRESLHENNRVVATMTGSGDDPMQSARWSDAVKLLGATIGNPRSISDESDLEEWFNQHQPTVLAIDASLPESTQQNWMRAVQAIRKTRSNQQPTVERVVLFRSVPTGQLERDATAFKRSSLLRSDALLTGPAVLAGDFASDAFMMVAAGTAPPSAIEVMTLDDLSGAIRRDISITSGISLSEGQVRGKDEQQVAANRRLQIATARVAQTTNLRNQLAAAITRIPDHQTTATVQQTLRNAIAMTSPNDQTRLLWDRLVELMNHRDPNGLDAYPGLLMVQDALLKQLSQTASPASTRRWAEFTIQTIATSIEREQLQPIERQTARWSGEVHAESMIGQASFVEPVADEGSGNGKSLPIGNTGRLSPFQVAPASYTTTSHSAPHSASTPTAILIPESKPTVWQTPRGMAVNSASDQASATEPTDELQRTNWDYHPVVMAGRKIGQSHSQTQAAFNPPTIASRPYLDGRLDETCWKQAVELGPMKVAQDHDYYFVAIDKGGLMSHDSTRIRLDCDGDYLTSIELDWHPDGNRRTTVDGLRQVPLTWYASQEQDQATIELAIGKDDLPGPLHRIRIDRFSGDSGSTWEAMPDTAKWFPRIQP